MKFDLRKQFSKLFSLLAISVIILVDVLARPAPRPFGELPYLDPVADAQQVDEYGIQERRSNKRVAFFEDNLSELLVEEQDDDGQLRHKRIGS